MRKFIEVLINLIIWLIIGLLFYRFWLNFYGKGNVYKTGIEYFIIVIKSLPQLFIGYYLAYILLVPKYLQRKKIGKYFILLLLSSIVITQFGSFGMISWMYRNGYTFSNWLYMLLPMAIIPLTGGIIGSLTKGTILWYSSIAEKKAIEKKHLESQTALLMLKAQINPHFLFNSLNNIDVLIGENPIKASEYLKKLSDIFRYVLYETKEDEVELSTEIEQIKCYIELQKIRTGNPHYVNFNFFGSFKGQKIAPMIFIPFVENAFKHSKDKTVDNAIDIEFTLQEKMIKMICKNYYESNQPVLKRNDGLGIDSIQQRLNLLYPDSHHLIIDKANNWFSVSLIIYLKDGN